MTRNGSYLDVVGAAAFLSPKLFFYGSRRKLWDSGKFFGIYLLNNIVGTKSFSPVCVFFLMALCVGYGSFGSLSFESKQIFFLKVHFTQFSEPAVEL